MAINVPHTDTTQNLGKLWPAHVVPLETFAQMDSVTAPDIVENLHTVNEFCVHILFEHIVQCEIRGTLSAAGVSSAYLPWIPLP